MGLHLQDEDRYHIPINDALHLKGMACDVEKNTVYRDGKSSKETCTQANQYRPCCDCRKNLAVQHKHELKDDTQPHYFE